MIKVVVLGASGSVGKQAIKLIKQYPTNFKLVGFSVNRNLSVAKKIIKNNSNIKFAITDRELKLPESFKNNYSIKQLLSQTKPDIVLNAISGSAGLSASFEVINAKINLALANKESLVMAGDLLLNLARKNKVKIIPVDSEHNAIYQLLKAVNKSEIKKIILTASGGPFYGYSKKQLAQVTTNQALAHPNWKMGPKISVDSATMFNKGLEIIEAHHLFGISYDQIKVMINRNSQVHSLVELVDGSLRAHLGVTSMELPILNALSPTILKYQPQLDLNQDLAFKLNAIKVEDYPALKLAYQVGKMGKEYPLVYCVANEVAVNAFLKNQIKFNAIYPIVSQVLKNYKSKVKFELSNLFKIENEVKQLTLNILAKTGGKL